MNAHEIAQAFYLLGMLEGRSGIDHDDIGLITMLMNKGLEMWLRDQEGCKASYTVGTTLL